MRRALPWVLILLSPLISRAQGTAFLYQGSLNDGGLPANGTYDLTFTLYDSSNQPGNIIAGTITNLGTGISNGLFTTMLDFGGVFDGTARWLQIGLRTNGGANFVALIPRQPVATVPYAIFSGSATNVVGALSAANLAPVTSMIASSSNGLYSALQSSFTTNLASFTNSGLESSQDAIRLASVPYQQAGIQQTPIRGYVSWYATGSNPTEPVISNVMYTTRTSGLYNYGYQWIFIDDGWGSTNRDANGNLQWNTNKFPSGSNFVNISHQMGFKLALYTDGGGGNGLTSSGAQIASDPTHMAQDVNQFLNWGLDGGKWDFPVLNLQLGAAVLATNTARPFYLICGDGFPNRVVTAQWVSMMNAFRGVANGDLTSFRSLLAWCDEFVTNGFYRWIGPGHVYDFDGIGLANSDVEPGTYRGTQGQIVMDAITSGVMLHSQSDVNGNVGTSGAFYQLTNSSVLAIQADPAVIAGQRVLQTNNIDVWLKPLGSAVGPQFAVGMICRNANSNITVTIPFDSTGLNLPEMVQPSTYPAGYSVYNCVSNTWLSTEAASSVTVTLTNHQSALLRLYPGTAVTTNYLEPFVYAPTLTAIVISNGVQRVINVPWDPDATNFIDRAQVANDPIQCYAVQVLFTKLKSIGIWTNRLDVLYPMIPAQPYLNAFSTNFTIAPVGSVITNSFGIAGNGISSYFTTGYHFITNAVNLSLNSASVGVYNGTTSPTGIVFIGNFDGTSQIALMNSSGTVFENVNDILSGPGLSNSRNCDGLWVASRTGKSTAYIMGRPGIANGGLTAVSVPNAYCDLDAETRGFECNAQLRGAWIGGGLNPAEMGQLNDIWEEYESILGRQAP